MAIDSTFWVAVSFVIFFGGLIYLKVPNKINDILNKLILDIKNEIDESEKLRTEAKTLLDSAQNKLDKALLNYKLGHKLDPKNYEINKGIGLVLLSLKDYHEAWDYFESRIFARQNRGKIFNAIKNNLFSGLDIAHVDKLVIVSEQGIGDKILFSSMYSDILNFNIKLKFLTEPRLLKLFKRSFSNC